MKKPCARCPQVDAAYARLRAEVEEYRQRDHQRFNEMCEMRERLTRLEALHGAARTFWETMRAVVIGEKGQS